MYIVLRVPYTCNFIAIDSIMLNINCRGNQISKQGCLPLCSTNSTFKFLRIKTYNLASFVSNKNYLTPWVITCIRHMESFKVCKMFSQLFRLRILCIEYM